MHRRLDWGKNITHDKLPYQGEVVHLRLCVQCDVWSVIGYVLLHTHLNSPHKLCKRLAGLEPLAVGHLGIIKPCRVHSVELEGEEGEEKGSVRWW